MAALLGRLIADAGPSPAEAVARARELGLIP